ncbi:MAG: putative quinol monooxygenase [Bacteroidota bacterium]
MTNTSTLAVIGLVTAKPDHVDRVYEALTALIAPTRAEDGNIRYDLHRSDDDANVFAFIEEWASRPIWEEHMESDHIAQFKENTDGMLEDMTVYPLYETP